MLGQRLNIYKYPLGRAKRDLMEERNQVVGIGIAGCQCTVLTMSSAFGGGDPRPSELFLMPKHLPSRLPEGYPSKARLHPLVPSGSA